MAPQTPADKRAVKARTEAVLAGLDRKGREARQRLVTQHEKTESIEKMLGQSKRYETAALVRAVASGVPQAECARILGLSTGRVWQLLRDAGAFDAEPAEPEPAAPEPEAVSA